MKTIFLLLLPAFALAGGPKYQHAPANLDDEVRQIYHDIRNVLTGDVRISSVTIGTATISNLRGTITADNACAGCVGEYISSAVAYNAVSLTSGIAKTVTSISLTAGDWDVCGNVTYAPSGTTSISLWNIQISATTDALPNTNIYSGWSGTTTVPGGVIGDVAPCIRLSIGSTTTMYLTTITNFTVSTLSAGGTLWARRVR